MMTSIHELLKKEAEAVLNIFIFQMGHGVGKIYISYIKKLIHHGNGRRNCWKKLKK